VEVEVLTVLAPTELHLLGVLGVLDFNGQMGHFTQVAVVQEAIMQEALGVLVA
jgi:hypothetical protein